VKFFALTISINETRPVTAITLLRTVRAFSCALFVVLAAACGSSPSPTAPSGPSTPTLTSVTLAATVPSFTTSGSTVLITATGTFSNGTAQNLTSTCTNWQADNTFVLNVNSAGALTPLNSGSSTVTATCQGVFTSHLFVITVRPNQLFTVSGNGNNVINLPGYVNQLHISGTYGSCCSNFIVWGGPATAACGSAIISGCHLIVNDLIGTIYGRTISEGTYVVNGNATIQIIDSTGVSWSMVEVR